MLAEILLFRGKDASVPVDTVSVHGTHAMRSSTPFISLLHGDEIWKTLEGGRLTAVAWRRWCRLWWW